MILLKSIKKKKRIQCGLQTFAVFAVIFSPSLSKMTRRIHCGRRTHWVEHSGCRRDTSAHTGLRDNKKHRATNMSAGVGAVMVCFRVFWLLAFGLWLGYLRIWHNIPCHPAAQWHVLAPTHSPPFRHLCRQLAVEGDKTHRECSYCTYFKSLLA